MHQGHLCFLQIYAEVMLQVPAFLEREIRAISVVHLGTLEVGLIQFNLGDKILSSLRFVEKPR